jgi:hypothetical protein
VTTTKTTKYTRIHLVFFFRSLIICFYLIFPKYPFFGPLQNVLIRKILTHALLGEARPPPPLPAAEVFFRNKFLACVTNLLFSPVVVVVAGLLSKKWNHWTTTTTPRNEEKRKPPRHSLSIPQLTKN